MFLEEHILFQLKFHTFLYTFFTEYYLLDVKLRAFGASKECKEKNPRMNENKLFLWISSI